MSKYEQDREARKRHHKMTLENMARDHKTKTALDEQKFKELHESSVKQLEQHAQVLHQMDIDGRQQHQQLVRHHEEERLQLAEELEQLQEQFNGI